MVSPLRETDCPHPSSTALVIPRSASHALMPHGHHEGRIVELGESSHGGLVEVIVVIVGDQDEVDRRKILEAQGRRREALDTHLAR
jgi:hypothetical protein